MHTLTQLLSPVSREEFLARHWEQAPLHVARGDPEFYGPLFGLRDLDGYLLSQSDSDQELIVLVPPPGSEREREVVAIRNVPLQRFYAAHSQGDTIILNRLHRTWPPFAHLAAALATDLSVGIGVNVYVTPPDHQGFDLHADLHDVLVLQLEGTKRWTIHAGSSRLPVLQRLPLVWHEEPPPNRDQPGELVLTADLEPGDLLYVPRGFVHSARASDQASVHATVGIHACYWVDLLAAALSHAASKDVALRRTLPPGFLDDPQAREAMPAAFGELLADLANNADFEAGLQTIRSWFVRERPFVPDGHFQALGRADRVEPDTWVSRRFGLECEVVEEGEQAVIRFARNNLCGPAFTRPVLDYIARTHAFRIRDLPDVLDLDGKLVLIRRLIREGLLTVAVQP